MAVNIQLAADRADERVVHKRSAAQKRRSGNSSPHESTGVPCRISMKKRWLALGVLIVALSLLAGCGAGPADTNGGDTAPSDATPVVAAGWKAYTNTMYRYSVEYPANWFPDDTSGTTDYLSIYNYD